jgi:hypothetical protein
MAESGEVGGAGGVEGFLGGADGQAGPLSLLSRGFTASDLTDLLRRISEREQSAQQQADLATAA